MKQSKNYFRTVLLAAATILAINCAPAQADECHYTVDVVNNALEMSWVCGEVLCDGEFVETSRMSIGDLLMIQTAMQTGFAI